LSPNDGFGIHLPPRQLSRIAAAHQGNYATFLNYLKTELRYMDAGE